MGSGELLVNNRAGVYPWCRRLCSCAGISQWMFANNPALHRKCVQEPTLSLKLGWCLNNLVRSEMES